METNYQDRTLSTTIPIPPSPSTLGYESLAGRIPDQSRPAHVGTEVSTGVVREVLALPSVVSFTYKHLKDFHLERIKFNEDGTERSQAVMKNHSSVLRSWVGYIISPEFRRASGLGDFEQSAVREIFAQSFLPVGEELGVGFTQCLTVYLTSLEDKGLSRNTRNDRKSIMRSIRESWSELARINGLPADFVDALRWLIDRSGHSTGAVACLSGTGTHVYNWLGGTVPSAASLIHIEALENFFKIPQGCLSSKLPDVVWSCPDGPVRTGTTKWREHLKQLHGSRYMLLNFPPHVEVEWQRLYRAYTDPMWARTQGLTLNSEWRIRQNTDASPTGEYKRSHLRSFFGYLSLPPEGSDPWQRGKGFAPESLTIAMLGDAELVLDYLNFCRERTHSKKFNTATNTFLAFSTQLLRPKTGYLWQQPDFGTKLPTPVSSDEWRAWCEANLEQLLGIRKDINTSKNGKFKLTRDPFDAVRDIIEQNQHPITVLMGMARNMESLVPLLRKGSPERLATHMRNLSLVKIATANPLRAENFSMMRFIPKNWDDLLDPDRLYVETEPESNLYQKPDGSFWLRFTEGQMKFGTLDVPLPKSVWGTLRDYLFNRRPVLNRALKRGINKQRAKFNLPLLSPDEELAIDRCTLVLRPTGSIYLMSLEKLKAYTGTEQLTKYTLLHDMTRLTQRFIPGCKGFGLHAFRHIVASEYIKNYPNGYAVAAAALNNTEAMVRKHYAWVRPCDRIKPWNDHFEKLQEAMDKGEVVN